MGKNRNLALQSLRHSVFAKGILLSTFGLGLTACSEVGINQYAQNNGSWQNLSSKQATPYFPNRGTRAPYVLMAQNNSIPQLRGLSGNARNAILQQYHFDEYPKNYAIAPSSSTPSNIAQTYRSKPVVASAQRQYFKHHLEEAAPRQVPNYARPQTKVQSAVPVLPEAKNGPAYQSTRSQTYNSPAAIPSRAVQPRAVQPRRSVVGLNVQPDFSGAATSFSESMKIAVVESPRLAIEDIKILEAEEVLEQAKSQGRFKLNFEGVAGASQNETEFRVIDRTDNDFRTPRQASLNLSLPLYQGGLLRAQRMSRKWV